MYKAGILGRLSRRKAGAFTLDVRPVVSDIVLTKTLNIMAKLYFDGVCVMHDVVENVKQAAALCPASVNVKVVEE